MSKRTYGHVLVLPSRRLVRTTAEDDFVKGNQHDWKVITSYFIN